MEPKFDSALVADISRVAQRPEFAAGNLVGQNEGVSAEHVDVVEPEQRQPGYILWANIEALATKLVHRIKRLFSARRLPGCRDAPGKQLWQ